MIGGEGGTGARRREGWTAPSLRALTAARLHMQLRSPPEHELEVGFGGRWRPASERQRKKICCCGCERRTDRDPLLQREVGVRSLANVEELVVRGQRDG